MNDITFACSATNKTTSGLYDYFLFSRVDGYAVILRSKTDSTEWLFYVINQDEDPSVIWAGDVTALTYQRPDEMTKSIRGYVITKMKTFNNADRRSVEGWN